MASENQWVNRIVKDAIKSAKDRMGRGWDVLSTDMQCAMACKEAVAVFQHIDPDHVSENTALRIIAACEGILQHFAETGE